MLLQRLRGLVGTTLLACVPWTALGVVTGLMFQFDLIPNVHAHLGRPFPGGMVGAGALVGLIIGAINGLTFGGLLMATERGKNLDEVRGWRFAVWGALSTALALWVFSQSPATAAVAGMLGAVGGVGALRLARRLGRGTELGTLPPGDAGRALRPASGRGSAHLP
jgi:hypothetical protein